MLLEGDKGGKQLEGVAMKGTIARRFEELDWDNNGQSGSQYILRTIAVCQHVLSEELLSAQREPALTIAHQHQSPAQ